MKPVMIATALFISGTSLSCAEDHTAQTGDSQNHAAASWSYDGQTGPDHWGELKPEYSSCAKGLNQTPIDIASEQVIDGMLPQIPLDYATLKPAKIKNTGHSIQVDIDSGGSLVVDDQDFALKQFHFHSPSENTINGESFPIEAHFVHQNSNGDLAVLAVLFSTGAADKTLTALWDQMPAEAGQSAELGDDALSAISTKNTIENYYRFNGSLTTPPCSEGVRWIVRKTPLTASAEQIETLKTALKHANNRPLQPLNARLVVD